MVSQFFFPFLILYWSCNGCGNGGWWNGGGGVCLVFSLTLFQFLRSGVCGLIFAIWFSVGLDCGFCPLGFLFAIWYSIGLDCGFCLLGFLFSLSWLLVPGFWLLRSLGLDFLFSLGWFIWSGFWFLYLLQTWNHPMGLTRSTINLSRWVQPEHLVGRKSNFRSLDSIGSGEG